jgi:hypothetical protein
MVKIQVPYFDNIEIELDDETDMDNQKIASAMRSFLSLLPSDRHADTRHVFSYYTDFIEHAGGEVLIYEAADSEKATIWNHVSPAYLTVEEIPHARTVYVVLEAECAWEEEHGMMMVWRNGKMLTKVGPYDGHLTNVDAKSEGGVSETVYAALDPRYTTRLL